MTITGSAFKNFTQSLSYYSLASALITRLRLFVLPLDTNNILIAKFCFALILLNFPMKLMFSVISPMNFVLPVSPVFFF